MWRTIRAPTARVDEAAIGVVGVMVRDLEGKGPWAGEEQGVFTPGVVSKASLVTAVTGDWDRRESKFIVRPPPGPWPRISIALRTKLVQQASQYASRPIRPQCFIELLLVFSSL